MRFAILSTVALLAAAVSPACAGKPLYQGTLGLTAISSKAADQGQLSWSSDLDLQITKPTSRRESLWIYLQDDYGKVRQTEEGTVVVSPDHVDYEAKYLRKVSERQSYFASYSLVGTHHYSEDDNAVGVGVRLPLSRYLDLDLSEEKVLGDVWQHKIQVYFSRPLGPRLKATGNGSASGAAQFGSSADGSLLYQLTHALALGFNATLVKKRDEAAWSRTFRFQAVWAISSK
jgi:hypothetical protein